MFPVKTAKLVVLRLTDYKLFLIISSFNRSLCTFAFLLFNGMSIKENIERLREMIPSSVKIVAISKTKSILEITEAYQAGQKIFGENKAQELVSKYDLLPSDIEWHFVGHLQSNKIKTISPFIHVIESVDSYRLLDEINMEAGNNKRKIDCLLQFHIAKEETKSGFSIEEAQKMLEKEQFRSLDNIRITGIMGIATFSCNEEIIRQEFRTLRSWFESLRMKYFKDSPDFKELSMGMSGDYRLAIEEGSTMVRIGTAIFGGRNYM